MLRMFFVFLLGLVAGALGFLLVSDRQVNLEQARDEAALMLGEAGRAAGRAAGDMQVAASVKTALTLQKDFALFGEIGVDVEDRIVTLTGHVATPEQRQLAELISKGVDGVNRVINKIEVSGE